MKILAIIGSLRKKNTYQSVKKIEEYHKSYSNFQYEYLFLKDINLKLCKGCYLCLSHGEEKCPLKDDRDIIVKKIENADGVILASPNYLMNVPWLVKNFIDRFAYTMHRPKYFNQSFMVLINSGSYMGTKQASKILEVMASGGKVITKIKVFNSPGMNDKKKLRQEKIIKNKAKQFYKQLSKKTNHRPSLAYLLWFSVFKATSLENQKHSPGDYHFYKDKRYFTEVKLNVFQNMIIIFFTALFTRLIRMGFI